MVHLIGHRVHSRQMVFPVGNYPPMLVRTIRRVGGSLALCIPRDVAAALDLDEGTPVSIRVVDGALSIQPVDAGRCSTASERCAESLRRR